MKTKSKGVWGEKRASPGSITEWLEGRQSRTSEITAYPVETILRT